MKSSLDHLPQAKQRELEHIVEVLREEFEKALAGGTQPWRREGKIHKIVLFGSFARGDWVDAPQRGYQSDWDLLVIVSHEKLADMADYWWEAEDRLLRDKRVGRPVTLIVHTLAQVNDALAKGEYFWADVARDGVKLLSVPGHPFVTPKPTTPAEAYATATKYFEEKSRSAADWLESAEMTMEQIPEGGTWSKKTAFNLHQAVETAYGCFLLVRSSYLPRSHNIKFLRSICDDLDRRLVPAWPRATRQDKARFELLRRAYVEARYSEHYQIGEEDLRLLTQGAQKLRSLVEQICREKLAELREKSAPDPSW